LKLPIAPEGRGYVFGSLAAATSLFVLGGRTARQIGLGVLTLTAGLAWFFRDPERYIIPIEDGILAPADGQVIRIDSVEVPELFPGTVRRVSIFMSLMDCHVNRSPVDATVRSKQTHAGGFLAAWDERASEENRRVTLGFEGTFPSGMRQVAGLVARQIVTRPEPGETVSQGERIGLIKFGSRVDVFFPLDMELMIDLGERTVAGVTAIAQKPRTR
jgi:phosphatidylserine decarboxylase